MRIFVIAIFMLSGCATLQSYRQQYCNYEGGFQRGSRDAETHRKMDEAFVGYCLADQKSQAQIGYRNGYNTVAGSYMGRY
jgi:hypothetical protein